MRSAGLTKGWLSAATCPPGWCFLSPMLPSLGKWRVSLSLLLSCNLQVLLRRPTDGAVPRGRGRAFRGPALRPPLSPSPGAQARGEAWGALFPCPQPARALSTQVCQIVSFEGKTFVDADSPLGIFRNYFVFALLEAWRDDYPEPLVGLLAESRSLWVRAARVQAEAISHAPSQRSQPAPAAAPLRAGLSVPPVFLVVFALWPGFFRWSGKDYRFSVCSAFFLEDGRVICKPLKLQTRYWKPQTLSFKVSPTST